jgi:DNA replication protein DnaC
MGEYPPKPASHRALLDRLTHHVHILELSGECFRLKQSKARGRVKADPETSKTISAS